jgi:two-component system cell cycle sensor histidine kinase PleC
VKRQVFLNSRIGLSVLKDRQFFRFVLILGLSAIFCTVAVARWLDLQTAERNQLALIETVSTEANIVVAKLQRNVIAYQLISHAITAVFLRQPDISQEEFSVLVEPFLSDNPSIVNIAVSRDYIVELVYPLSENASVVGLDHSAFQGEGALIDQALETGRLLMKGPIEFVQGGSGFIQRAAFQFDGQAAGPEPPFFVVSVVIDGQSLLDCIGLPSMDLPLDFALRNVQYFDSLETTVWGDPVIFDDRPVIRNVELDHGQWQFAFAPAFGWPQSTVVILENWIGSAVLFGTIASFLFAIFTLNLSKKQVVNRLLSGLEAIDDGFAIYDDRDQLVFANEPYLSFYDKSRDAIHPGNTFESIVRMGVERGQYPDAIGNEEAWIKARMEAHENPTEPIEQQLSGGRWLKIAEAKTPEGFTVGFRVDVTELKDAKEAAEAANAAKDDFLNIVSHELRTPLTTVIGFAKFLEKPGILKSFQKLEVTARGDGEQAMAPDMLGDFSDEISKMAERITSASNHLLSLINDILDHAKMKSETISMSFDMLRLDTLLTDMAMDLSVRAEPKGVQINVLCEPLEIWGDSIRLRQAILNVVGNAVKFTDAGSVDVSTEIQGESVLIKVQDTGCGISAADQERIFDKFTQVDTSVARRNSGTGLGLAISRGIINSHGGTIIVQSELHNGSLFIIELPVRAIASGMVA